MPWSTVRTTGRSQGPPCFSPRLEIVSNTGLGIAALFVIEPLLPGVSPPPICCVPSLPRPDDVVVPLPVVVVVVVVILT